LARYRQVEEDGIRFVFKYDESAPELLHIFVRYLTSIDDALDTYFGGGTVWNEARERFETRSETHGLSWFWLEPGHAVMVILCFRP
jgi:hypothetical protein